MIRTNEEIVELKQEIEASRYLTAYKNRLRDLFDTIADLQRQLAERDEEKRALKAGIEFMKTCRKEYVQQRVQKWLDTQMKCGHPQRYRAGIDGKTDAEWLKLECDECLICERDRIVQQRVDEAVLEAAKRRCEWCARGLELDGSYHRASGEIGQHLCQSLDILSIAAARSRVQGKPTQEEE